MTHYIPLLPFLHEREVLFGKAFPEQVSDVLHLSPSSSGIAVILLRHSGRQQGFSFQQEQMIGCEGLWITCTIIDCSERSIVQDGFYLIQNSMQALIIQHLQSDDRVEDLFDGTYESLP